MESPTPGPVSGVGQNSGVVFIPIIGIIGAVLVSAIIAVAIGVFRAQRNPERYGPQPARLGRPRQSRAKGLTRAVIESIPIVRFKNKDKDAIAAAQRDIELAVASPDSGAQSTTVDAHPPYEPHANIVNSNMSTVTPAMTTEGPSAAQPTSQTRAGSIECSICLEEFVENEEIRVLPCNHTFHPACIDPWLLNVSGTCPMW